MAPLARWDHGRRNARADHFFATEPLYESNIEILVGQRNSELATSGTSSTASATGDSIQEDQLATHMQLLKSRHNLHAAVERENLGQFASFQKAAENELSAVDYILENLDVQRGGEGSARDAMVLRATFRDPDPAVAATVLTAIFESYRDYVESHGQNKTKEAITLIETAQKEHEQELDNADREYREFVKSVPVLLEGDRVRDVHRDRLADLEAELNLVRSELAESSSRLEVIEKFLEEEDVNEIGDNAHLALLSHKEVERLKLFLDMTRGEVQSEAFQAEQPARQEVAKAQYTILLELLQKERTLAEDFGPGHPLVAATRQEIEVIQQFIKTNAPEAAVLATKKLDPSEMLKTYVLLLRNDIAEREKRKEILTADAETELLLAKSIEADFMTGTALKAKLNRAQSRYDEVIRRLHEINLAGSYAGFSTDLLSHPEINKEPCWPRLPLVLAIGGILGLAIGTTFAGLSEFLDATFR
ncbi:GumC family protein, partial [Novipirellula maiorica]